MSEVKKLLEDNEKLQAEIEELKTSLAGYEKDYDEIVKDNDSLRAQITTLRAGDYEDAEDEEEATEDEEAEEEEATEEDEEEANEEEEATEEEEEDKAGDDMEKEAQALARALRVLGVQPVATKPKAVALSKEEILEKFAGIADHKERSNFFNKHRQQIFN